MLYKSGICGGAPLLESLRHRRALSAKRIMRSGEAKSSAKGTSSASPTCCWGLSVSTLLTPAPPKPLRIAAYRIRIRRPNGRHLNYALCIMNYAFPHNPRFVLLPFLFLLRRRQLVCHGSYKPCQKLPVVGVVYEQHFLCSLVGQLVSRIRHKLLC